MRKVTETCDADKGPYIVRRMRTEQFTDERNNLSRLREEK
jgi:hypothetical protein